MSKNNEYIANKAIASGSSFYYSFLFLPKAQREAITTVYAFCRIVDDIVDEDLDNNVALQKLSWWSAEIDRIFTGNPEHPLGISLVEVIAKYNLQRVWFDEIIQGMHMDLQFQGYETMQDLKVYCHCVASTVGMMAASIFGYKNDSTLEYAKDLGLALQTINIIRDIGEDARRGRIYLPEEELSKYAIAPQELLDCSISNHDNFKDLLQNFANIARDLYQQALSKLDIIDRKAQRSGLIMANIYFNILKEIENSNFEVLQQKISITPLRKLWHAITCLMAEKKYCKSQALVRCQEV